MRERYDAPRFLGKWKQHFYGQSSDLTGRLPVSVMPHAQSMLKKVQSPTTSRRSRDSHRTDLKERVIPRHQHPQGDQK